MHYGNSALLSNNAILLPRLRWQPIPNSSQELAIDTRAHQTLYCGTRGCGKTAAQLMTFRSYVGQGFGANWKGIIFDTEYKPLEEVKSQARKFFGDLGDGARENKSAGWWEWPTGEKLLLRAVKKIDDVRKYLGHEYPFIGFNELSKWPTRVPYDMLLGSQRSPELTGAMPVMVFSTTNPNGPGVPWIKETFVDPVPYGVIAGEDIDVPIGNGEFKTVHKTKVCIMGSYIENHYYKPEDVATLMIGVRGDPALEAAWLRCDWDAAYLDGALGRSWDRDTHILPDFKIPPQWKVNRAFDWGSKDPFAVGWFAESNGEEITHEGKTYCFPPGTVIMFYEWYGAYRTGTNRGIELSPKQIAHGVLRREHDFRATGIVDKNTRIFPGPADNQIANESRSDIETIKTTMAKHGCRWTKSDKSPGSRIQGLQMLRQYLTNALTGEGKGFYVQRRCRATIRTLPTLEPDGEDIMDEQEDHLYDMIRYRLMTRRLGVPNVDFQLR